MDCPECLTPVRLSLSRWVAPFLPAWCPGCGFVLQFHSFLRGLVGLVEILAVATAAVWLYRNLP